MELRDGESYDFIDTDTQTYLIKRRNGIYSCTCRVWRSQRIAVERRTCIHIQKFLQIDTEREVVVNPMYESNPQIIESPSHARKSTRSKSNVEIIPQTIIIPLSNRYAPELVKMQEPKPFSSDLNLSEWVYTERLNGISMVWSPPNCFVYFVHQNRLIQLPNWFIKDFPNFPVQGILWAGRHQKGVANTIIALKFNGFIPDSEYTALRFMALDIVSDEPFESRQNKLREYIHLQKPKYLRQVSFLPCLTPPEQMMASILEKGGEGIWFRKRSAPQLGIEGDYFRELCPVLVWEGIVVKRRAENAHIKLPNKDEIVMHYDPSVDFRSLRENMIVTFRFQYMKDDLPVDPIIIDIAHSENNTVWQLIEFQSYNLIRELGKPMTFKPFLLEQLDVKPTIYKLRVETAEVELLNSEEFAESANNHINDLQDIDDISEEDMEREDIERFSL